MGRSFAVGTVWKTTIVLVVIDFKRGRRPSQSPLAKWFGWVTRTELKTIPNVGRCPFAGAFVTSWVAAGQLGGEDDFRGCFSVDPVDQLGCC